MVAVSPEALAVIRQVTAHPALEATSGLRIARRSDAEAPLEVKAVAVPQPEDHVVGSPDGRLFLGPGVPERLDGRELDAVTDDEGRVRFVLRAAS